MLFNIIQILQLMKYENIKKLLVKEMNYLGIFVSSLLTMLFAILDPKYDAVFKNIKLTNYNTIFNASFLLDIEFGKELQIKSNYDSPLTIKKLCYLGTCVLLSKSVEINNCSKACIEQSNICYYGEEECLKNECKETYYKYDEGECQEFNRIKKWRDTEMYNYSKIVEFIPYTQLKTKNENCDNGYRRCGKINEDEDFICFKEDYSDFKCPINKIIILSNNETPSDNLKYKKYKIGEDKNIFISNENTDDYLINDLFINFEKDKEDSNFQLIDVDSYLNFSNYNNISLEWWRKSSSIVKLNAVQYHLDFTVNEMRKYQETFSERNELYSKEKLKEMNLKANSCNELLINLSLWALIYLGLILNCILGCFYNNNKNRNNDIIPMMYVIIFYIVLSPFILLSFISFIITIYKSFIYNKYSSMKYIDDYKYFSSRNGESNLDVLIYYNKAQFINLLIIMIITIIYPIINKKASTKKDSIKKIDRKKIESIKECDSYNLCLNSDNYETPQFDGQTYQGEKAYYE